MVDQKAIEKTRRGRNVYAARGLTLRTDLRPP